MIEWALIPALMAGAAFIPKGKPNDKKKIQTIFENTGYGIRNKKGDPQFPKFKKKLPIIDGPETIGTRYLFTIPLGLPATKMADMEKNVGFFTDGLNRPVIVEFKRENPKIEISPKYLTISVFNKDIPNLYPYAKVPKLKDGEDSNIPWMIPLGRTLETTIWHDFSKVPHMTVAGMTRFGKTVFLKVLTTFLIEHHGEDAKFYIIDLKGGLEFGRYEKLKQVKGVACDPFEALVMLEKIHEKLMKYFALFKKNYWSNINDTPLKARRFIIVDEAAQLAPEKWMPEEMKKALSKCQWILGEITRIGGGLGFHEVFCTQYPTSDTLPRSIKQNSDGKISFRLPTGYASEVAIDEYGAEKLPSDIKGRALYKTHEIKEFQAPFLSDKEMWNRLERYVRLNETPDTNGKEETASGGNFVKFGNNEVRHKGTNTKKTQSGKESKRPKTPKRNEGIPSDSNTPREEHLLPKRKRKGVSRKQDGGEMESSN
jgi:S-DNA-T family DNA segregation ATPase FtsK/SpoIIIE